MRRPDRQRGYTLVEVLVAFVILAMALTVLFRIFSTGLKNVDAASGYAEAVVIAESRLGAPGLDEALVPGVAEGVESGGYTWTRTIERYEPAYRPDVPPPLPAYRIGIAVEWPAGRGTRRIEMATVRLGTPEAGRRP